MPVLRHVKRDHARGLYCHAVDAARPRWALDALRTARSICAVWPCLALDTLQASGSLDARDAALSSQAPLALDALLAG